MIPNPFANVEDEVALSPAVADEVKTTTCYMCACRCGIRVHLKSGTVRYIDGNPDHPVNRGVLCAKGAAGIMNHYAPARLRAPLLRTGPRGSGQFEEIGWEEALALATGWLEAVRERDPKRLAFFTGRDQSQSLTGWWAQQFGTPNFAAHGGFCSVNMATAGLYSVGGAFWEFGEPDWDLTRYLLLFGVAEDHDSNPIKAGLGRLKTRGGTKIVAINPCRTGYSAIADEWVPIRPGTDGLLILALIHELLRAEQVDLDFLVRYTNAPWLVIQDPGGPGDGLIARDATGHPLCADTQTRALVDALAPGISPALAGRHVLADGRVAVPAFELLARRYLDPAHAPEAVAERTGVPAAQIRRLAAEIATAAFQSGLSLERPWTDWAGRRQERMVGRPVSIHAMRGIAAHANGFHTCRALHLLQMLLGSIDAPGGWRYKAPFPKPVPAGPRPSGKATAAHRPLSGPPLGTPLSPADLLVDEGGKPLRIDQAFSWDFPLAAHGLMHLVLRNAWARDPYGIDVLVLYMANMGWNSSMNVGAALHHLTDRDDSGDYRIPKIIYSDAYYSETVPYADLVLPDTTYLERFDCISLLDRPISSAHGPADAIRQPVVRPDRDVRPFQDVLLDLGARLKLPGMAEADGRPVYPGGYADYIVNHQRSPGIGPLAGWRGEGDHHGRGAPNPAQLERYLENGAFWSRTLPADQQYFRHANGPYLAYAAAMGWIPNAESSGGGPGQIVLHLYSEPLQTFRLAALGHGPIQPPDDARDRLQTFFDPLPIWYPPFQGPLIDPEAYPLHAITQRPPHMYHSWGSQNGWLRQITSRNRLFIHRATARKLGLADDDWVWVVSPAGRVKGQVRLIGGVEPGTVWTWNAIGKRAGAWGLGAGAPEATRGFVLNHVISDLLPRDAEGKRFANADPVTGQAAWYDLRVRIEKCTENECGWTEPCFADLPDPPGGCIDRPDRLRFGAAIKDGPCSGGRTPSSEWIGNRGEASGCVEGVVPGRGNRTPAARDV